MSSDGSPQPPPTIEGLRRVAVAWAYRCPICSTPSEPFLIATELEARQHLQTAHVAPLSEQGPVSGQVFRTNSHDRAPYIYSQPWKMNRKGDLTVVALRYWPEGFFEEKRMSAEQLTVFEDTGEQVQFLTAETLPHPTVNKLAHVRWGEFSVQLTGAYFGFEGEEYWQVAHGKRTLWVKRRTLEPTFNHKFAVGEVRRQSTGEHRVVVSRVVDQLFVKSVSGLPYYRTWTFIEMKGREYPGREEIVCEDRL